jgi:hypothetical protein
MPAVVQDNRPTPGFQGSETSGAEVTIYRQGGDRILLAPEGIFEFQALRRSKQAQPIADSPSLMSVQTNKAIGPAAGNWSVTCKTPKQSQDFSTLFDAIADDDWIDITMTRHGKRWHVMRGLVDEVRRSIAVAGTGATSTSYTISGRDFGKVWEMTPVWFSPQAAENVHGHVAAKVFTTKADQEGSNVAGNSLVLGSPSAAVRGYLFGFLEELEGIGRANWNPPKDMPGITTIDRAPNFVASLFYNNVGFTNVPNRIALDPSFINAGGMLWDLAKEWSDPLFTELFVDLFVGGSQALQTIETTPEDTVMTVVFRDKPFPVMDSATGMPTGQDSPWFSLPVFVIPREVIVTSNVGRSGLERFNAFFISPPLYQEAVTQASIDMRGPLWDKDDILRHGLRRYDVQSKYTDPGADFLTMIEQQRAISRDWYAINPYLLNGTIELGIGMPDIRIGSRAVIPGARSEQENEQYYIESVTHNWQYGMGTKTSLGVTRGWRGTDDSLTSAISSATALYQPEATATPEEA